MECRSFEIILVSAHNLPNVRESGQMKVYAKVSIRGDSDSKRITTVDRVNKTNPYWNCKTKYTLPEKVVQNEGSILDIKLYCERSFLDDKYVGEVNLDIKNLFGLGHLYNKIIELDVNRRDAVGAYGKLKLWFSFATTTILVPNRSSTMSEEGDDELLEIVFYGASQLIKVVADSVLPGSSLILGALGLN